MSKYIEDDTEDGIEETEDTTQQEILSMARDYAQPDDNTVFSNEDLVNARELRSSQVAPYFIKVVIPGLSGAGGIYKSNLSRWVLAHLSTDELLANHTPRSKGTKMLLDQYEVSKMRASLGLKNTHRSATRWDKMQPWWGTIDDDLMYAYEALHTRTYGAQRERMINLEKITSTKTTVMSGQVPIGEDKKKKGKWLFGR